MGEVRTGSEARPDSFLPLSPAVFHILLALAGGDRHGYAIMQEVEQITEGTVALGPGTLYAALKRLLERHLVIETDGPEDADDERRRYYRLSDLGRRVLAAECARLETLVRLARRRDLLGGAAS